MGYRAAWLSNAGAVSRHYEDTLHALDREIPLRPLRLLIAGVDNGGAVEVFRNVLPEGSTVTALDKNPECATLQGIDVLVGDVTDRDWIKGTFKGRMFDAVVDSTRTHSPWLWAFLEPGGVLVLEDYDTASAMTLVQALMNENESWLPMEEVLRINVFPHSLVIEKRHARVLPYLNIMTGNFADVTSEADMFNNSVKRVIN